MTIKNGWYVWFEQCFTPGVQNQNRMVCQIVLRQDREKVVIIQTLPTYPKHTWAIYCGLEEPIQSNLLISLLCFLGHSQQSAPCDQKQNLKKILKSGRQLVHVQVKLDCQHWMSTKRVEVVEVVYFEIPLDCLSKPEHAHLQKMQALPQQRPEKKVSEVTLSSLFPQRKTTLKE